MIQAIRIEISGIVQGVGFRPFVCRLAQRLCIFGWVTNTPQGVVIEAEARHENLRQFLQHLQLDCPPLARIESLQTQSIATTGATKFKIAPSLSTGNYHAEIPPDVATCPLCVEEIFTPDNRRYLYPFTTCTDCGPRFSIATQIPFDRANTIMATFVMCKDCQEEYQTPDNRRFHSQTNCCPVCGPQLQLWNRHGEVVASDTALRQTVAHIEAGNVVAIKGGGGFQLVVSALSETAIAQLRLRKHRPDKPLAVMFPNLKDLQNFCEIDNTETQLLLSCAAPIVLLQKKSPQLLPENIAPKMNTLGAMLPYSPLHHILCRTIKKPLIVTSGNLSFEPICIDNDKALQRLANIADFFLVHDRSIVRPLDDSVAKIVAQKVQIWRKARGYTPQSFTLPEFDNDCLAVGAQQKNTVCFARRGKIYTSQHLGDMHNQQSNQLLQETVDDWQNLYHWKPKRIVRDLHPDYTSSKWCPDNINTVAIQHHIAHAFSCIAEHNLELPVLAVVWDGTGYGTDGAIWGGEFFVITQQQVSRFAHWRYFPLPGGELAIQEPRRSALGLLYQSYQQQLWQQQDLLQQFSPKEIHYLRQMLTKNLGCHQTSSVGRLFDAVAALTGICQVNSFEGQAAMILENLVNPNTNQSYSVDILKTGKPYIVDWQAMLAEILADIRSGKEVVEIVSKFHNTLVSAIAQLAKISGCSRIVLSGGCFQNSYLLEQTLRVLPKKIQVYWNQMIPPNDAGISFGQIAADRYFRKNL